jgi:hypothetical protein
MKRRNACVLALLAALTVPGARVSVAEEGTSVPERTVRHPSTVGPLPATLGPYADPFLAAGDAIVRGQGFRGDFTTLVGLSGLADQPAMCRHDCSCRETMHSAAALRALVTPLKGSVTRFGEGGGSAASRATPDEAWEALRGEIAAGRLVLAEGVSGPGRLDLVVGCENDPRTLIVRGRDGLGRYPFADWVKGHWTFATARIGATTLPGPKAEMDAIAGMLARSQQPRIEGGCVNRSERTQNAIGLEAYDLWVERAKEDAPSDPAAKGARLESWSERSEVLARFMRTTASHQKGETAARLKAAAAIVQKEVESGLEPLVKSCPYPPAPDTAALQADPQVRARQAELMAKAGDLRRKALETLEPAAFDHLGLSPEQRQAASLKSSGKPADPAALKRMLKSPDATMRTLGALATRRSGDAVLPDALVSNLDSPDPVEARTTLAALRAVKPNDLIGLLKQQSKKMAAASAVADDGSLGPDGIGTQIQYLVQDLERQAEKDKSKPHPLACLLSGPFLIGILGIAVLGLGLVAWKVAGPQRLASSVEFGLAPVPAGIPPEAARLEELLARPPATGLLLTHLDPKEQAYRQGLRPGDIITKYGGSPVASLDELRRLATQPGAHQREIAARRDLKVVKTVVGPGALGIDGVAVTRGTPFWRRQAGAEFVPDYSGFAGEGEHWYQFTRHGRKVGFERRRFRWLRDELEIACVAGFQPDSPAPGDHGEESVRVVQRLGAGEKLECRAIRMTTRGGRPVDVNASFAGGRWVIMLNGQAVTRKIPETALPATAIAVLAATLPFENRRAYDVIQINETVFEPSYGCQIVALGPEQIELNGRHMPAWGFALLEYGVRQMAFWLDPQRHVVRAEYAGIVATLTTPEEALAGLPESLVALTQDS